MTVPPRLHGPAEQVKRDGVEGALDLDVPVRMDRPRAALEDRERLLGQWTERRLVGLEIMREHLAAGRPVDPDPRDRPVPVPEEGVLIGEAVEAAPLERVVLHIAAAS